MQCHSSQYPPPAIPCGLCRYTEPHMGLHWRVELVGRRDQRWHHLHLHARPPSDSCSDLSCSRRQYKSWESILPTIGQSSCGQVQWAKPGRNRSDAVNCTLPGGAAENSTVQDGNLPAKNVHGTIHRRRRRRAESGTYEEPKFQEWQGGKHEREICLGSPSFRNVFISAFLFTIDKPYK